MNTWNDIEHGFAPARATQYTISDADQLAATLYKLFHGRYVNNDNGHVITLSDGTSLTITLGDSNTPGENVGTGAHSQDMRAHADRRIIERAHLHTNTNHAGTITSLTLILFYQGETMPATIRTAHADITAGTFATTRDKRKPLATIRTALTQSQINEWVTREQQALADMLTGETITNATDGVFTLASRDNDSESSYNIDNEDASEAGATNAGDANTITVHATLNNQPRNNKGSRHATTITLTGGNTIGPITHAWVTRTRVQDTREQPTNTDKTQPMTENTAITGDDNNNVTATTRRGRRETTVITLHATTPDNPTPIALYTSVYSGRTAHHGLTIEHSNGTVVNGEAAATHTTIRLPHK